MAYRLDIRETLRRIDRRDFGYFDSLSEDERKGFAPPVVLRWASAVASEGETHLWLVNEIANVHYHDLYQHPELQYKLMASCGSGVTRRHEWIPGVKPPKKRSPVMTFLEHLQPSASDFELDLLYANLTETELRTMLDDCAIEARQAKIVLSAFKKES